MYGITKSQIASSTFAELNPKDLKSGDLSKASVPHPLPEKSGNRRSLGTTSDTAVLSPSNLINPRNSTSH